MPTKYKLRVTVSSLPAGDCPQGHVVGESWILEGGMTPAKLCGHAYCAMFPVITPLRFGGEQPWDKDKDVTRVACTDAEHPVIFEIRRLREP